MLKRFRDKHKVGQVRLAKVDPKVNPWFAAGLKQELNGNCPGSAHWPVLTRPRLDGFGVSTEGLISVC